MLLFQRTLSGSQHHVVCSSQPLVTPDLGDLMPSSGSHNTQHSYWTHIYLAAQTFTQTITLSIKGKTRSSIYLKSLSSEASFRTSSSPQKRHRSECRVLWSTKCPGKLITRRVGNRGPSAVWGRAACQWLTGGDWLWMALQGLSGVD